MDKLGIGFNYETREKDKKRLTNQLWKLIPMRENNEDWSSHLTILIEEIAGLADLYRDKPEGLILVSKMKGLHDEVCDDFMLYRKTVFRCIELLNQVLNDE